MPSRPHTALFLIAAVVLSLLLVGIRNAWEAGRGEPTQWTRTPGEGE